MIFPSTSICYKIFNARTILLYNIRSNGADGSLRTKICIRTWNRDRTGNVFRDSICGDARQYKLNSSPSSWFFRCKLKLNPDDKYLFIFCFLWTWKIIFLQLQLCMLLQLAMKAKNKSYCFKCLVKTLHGARDLLACVVIVD